MNLHPVTLPDGFVIQAIPATSDYQKQQGLRGFRSLNPNCGMLFLYDHLQIRAFTMGGCFLPLDIIWMDQDKRVVEMVSAKPDDVYCGGNSPSQYVLEVNAGCASQHGVRLGSVLRF